MTTDAERVGLAWQTGIWDRISDIYVREIDRRFAPVVDGVVRRAELKPGATVLDLGTGTGSVALVAARLVGPGGRVEAHDISAEMLAQARMRLGALGIANITFHEDRAEAIDANDVTFDAVLASLSLMYVIDRAAAAHEIARVLKPGGRIVAAVWAGPDQCDLVKFQQLAGSFAPSPPVPGVGPGALADPSPFLDQLAAAGVDARVETETLGFGFDDFASAWDTMASVTTANLSPDRQAEAKAAVMAALWPAGDGPRHFSNMTRFLVGKKG